MKWLRLLDVSFTTKTIAVVLAKNTLHGQYCLCRVFNCMDRWELRAEPKRQDSFPNKTLKSPLKRHLNVIFVGYLQYGLLSFFYFAFALTLFQAGMNRSVSAGKTES